MKKKSSSRSAFVTFRSISALLLCLAGVILALFASGAVRLGDASSSKKIAGVSNQKIVRGGGGAPLSNSPGEPTQASSQNQAATPYNGPQNDLRPVAAVRSDELRHIHPIHPSKAPKHDHPEPIRPHLRARMAASTALSRRRKDNSFPRQIRRELDSTVSAPAREDSFLRATRRM
jgi:hypothetical protein